MIDTNKSFEELENDFWCEPTFDSYVVTTVLMKYSQNWSLGRSSKEVNVLKSKEGSDNHLSFLYNDGEKSMPRDMSLLNRFENELMVRSTPICIGR